MEIDYDDPRTGAMLDVVEAIEKEERNKVMPNLNNMCDGCHCTQSDGEVRKLPVSKDKDHGNMILCYSCCLSEIKWRMERNLELAEDCRFDTPNWRDLEIYDPS